MKRLRPDIGHGPKRPHFSRPSWALAAFPPERRLSFEKRLADLMTKIDDLFYVDGRATLLRIDREIVVFLAAHPPYWEEQQDERRRHAHRRA